MMSAMRKWGKGAIVMLAAGIIVVGISSPAGANEIIQAGHDLYNTPEFLSPDLSFILGAPTTLRGENLGTFGGFGGLGDTDTIVERKFDMPEAGGTIDIEIVALNLVSVSPVTIPAGQTGTIFDGRTVDIEITLDPSMPSLGTMTIPDHTGSNGGTWDSVLDPVSTLIRVTDVSLPSLTAVFPATFDMSVDPLDPAPWTHDPLPPVVPGLTTNFFLPPDTTIQMGIVPVIPEPATLGLALAALAVGYGSKRRARRCTR